MRHLIRSANSARGSRQASVPAPLDPDTLAALQAQLAAQQVQIGALQTQTTTQQQQLDAQSTQISAQQQQFAAQQAQLNAQAVLLAQLILPQLIHDDTGAWSVSYIGTLPALWQVWVRSDLNPDWSNSAAYTPANFPVNDIGLAPFGAQWWQIKVSGSDGSNTVTPFSNIVSLGPVPSP